MFSWLQSAPLPLGATKSYTLDTLVFHNVEMSAVVCRLGQQSYSQLACSLMGFDMFVETVHPQNQSTTVTATTSYTSFKNQTLEFSHKNGRSDIC